jgi:hypothetical protein
MQFLFQWFLLPSIKKKRTKRSKKKSTNVTEEIAATPPPSAEKSKKKKKSKKSKVETSKIAHTMESLYLDPIGDQPAESEKTGNEDQGNPTQTLEMFSKIVAKKNTEDKRHPITQKIINDVLREINDADVVPDANTSLAQEEQGTGKDPENDQAEVEKQVSNKEGPKDDTYPENDQAVVEKLVSNEEGPKDDTQADKSEESKNSEEEEEGSKASEQNAGGEKDIVDADNYDLDLSLRQVVEDNIARRTRSGKVFAAATAPSNKEKKKSAAKPVKYGPNRSSSKIVTHAEKKKSLKRKEPPNK